MRIKWSLLWVALALAYIGCIWQGANAQAATTCVNGDPTKPPSATITFVPPTARTDGSAITGALTYNLYQSTTSGAEVQVLTGITGSPVSVTTGLKSGTSYYWQLSAVETGVGVQSALTNEVCKTMPAVPPGTFTINVAWLLRSIRNLFSG